jgi:hypothetical protein
MGLAAWSFPGPYRILTPHPVVVQISELSQHTEYVYVVMCTDLTAPALVISVGYTLSNNQKPNAQHSQG